jgi:hypothetical protein
VGQQSAPKVSATVSSTYLAGYGDVEMPWWTYGWRGMQLWFPSSLAEPLSPSTRDSMGFGASTDPELEFDQEVYPIGISLSDVAILGETRRPQPPEHAPLPADGLACGACMFFSV